MEVITELFILLRQIVDPEEIRHALLPLPSHVYDNWTDWGIWEASPEIKKLIPYYRSVYDEDAYSAARCMKNLSNHFLSSSLVAIHDSLACPMSVFRFLSALTELANFSHGGSVMPEQVPDY